MSLMNIIRLQRILIDFFQSLETFASRQHKYVCMKLKEGKNLSKLFYVELNIDLYPWMKKVFL